MPINTPSILKEIDVVLQEFDDFAKGSQYDDLSDKPEAMAAMIVSRLSSTIDRLSPKHSLYKKELDKHLNQRALVWARLAYLRGSLLALRREYELGYVQSVSELIHADTFASFLEMAEHLHEQNYKDAAAVLAGSVLEQHLRDLCDKNSMPTMHSGKWKKAEALNTELAGANIYNKLEQKNVTAWLGLRNEAAHGNYANYDSQQVRSMIASITEFFTRHPA